MLLLNTRFYVTPDMTRQILWDMAVSWWTTSDNYDFPDLSFDFKQEEYQAMSPDGRQKVSVYNYEKRFVIQLFSESDADKYETSFILDDISEHKILQITQDRTSLSMTTDSRSPRVYLPSLMKDILWHEYGDYDQNLITDNQPYTFRKKDVEWVGKLIKGELQFLNPVVYISVAFKTNIPCVDCSKIANDLMGQAHVIVESSPHIARAVRDVADSRNPYNGQVGIYLPDGNVEMVPVHDDEDNTYRVINCVRKMLASVSVPDSFNVAKIRQQHLFDQLANSGDSELVQLCENMLAQRDDEIAKLKEDLRAAVLKSDSLQKNFDKSKQESNEQDCVKIAVSGEEFYDGEIHDVILRVLQKEYDAMTGDPNLSSSRKYDVLGVVLAHNFPCKTDTELINAVKGAFKDGTVTREGIGYLRSIGFVVEQQSSNNHYRVYPKGFGKYYTTIASTPSDKSRGFKNMLTEFTNMLYGY